ncbi:hypothetical protein GC722_02540 [Auraticoccus sp. F435]|uniref:Uncharacterized protein n=1 Tax=Auraticoccus cholistanensis TaxID=2656650 RepID=A0A6A9UTB0_9ACTN|nr:hypothetical protein [Auraticoccus cholistanensis]MVA74912.1 hypothetical protein [Auraticoccus cholistanensis]
MAGSGMLLLALVPTVLVHTAFLLVVGLFSAGRVRQLGLAAGALLLLTSVLSTVTPAALLGAGWRPQSIGFVSAGFGLLGYVALGLIAAALVIGGRRRRTSEPHRQPYPSGPVAGPR